MLVVDLDSTEHGRAWPLEAAERVIGGGGHAQNSRITRWPPSSPPRDRRRQAPVVRYAEPRRARSARYHDLARRSERRRRVGRRATARESWPARDGDAAEKLALTRLGSSTSRRSVAPAALGGRTAPRGLPTPDADGANRPTRNRRLLHDASALGWRALGSASRRPPRRAWRARRAGQDLPGVRRVRRQSGRGNRGFGVARAPPARTAARRAVPRRRARRTQALPSTLRPRRQRARLRAVLALLTVLLSLVLRSSRRGRRPREAARRVPAPTRRGGRRPGLLRPRVRRRRRWTSRRGAPTCAGVVPRRRKRVRPPPRRLRRRRRLMAVIEHLPSGTSP